MKKLFSLIFSILLIMSNGYSQNHQKKEKLVIGADRLLSEYFHLIKDKRIGLVTNESGVLSNGTPLVDTLANLHDVKITALFGPEHGVRSNAPAGQTVDNSVDAKTGIKVYSLYGANKKPSTEMLKNVDVLIYDIQDVGARFYTFISTLFYIVQAGAENHIPVIILDRPNPINGINVEGPIRKEDEASFVGIAPLPIMPGMTIGELAKIYAGEHFIGKNLTPDLTIIKMKNWKRNSYLDQYSLPWIKPSPNIPDLETAIVYPGTCLIEGTNVSEGRGTLHPFLTIGAPFINSDSLIKKLKNYPIPGVELKPVSYTPVDIPKMVTNPKYKGENCNGITIKVVDRKKFKAVDFGLKLVCALHSLYPDKFKFRDSGFDRLSGDKSVREKILAGISPVKIENSWKKGMKDFLKIRKKYLLY
ncbi:MAG: DUF1343 domain-containing protein [Bacteroidetes bacterium]|nr:DUF1343 domain-containing protein [Bacteroidota bacterium]